ncbi:NAD(+) diphosphatase [Candidatus Sororendozoicomonas aggregata]|uniref:NAD(+) diphosphatase n=1 Tax=Candidatus Sororendozoicomonas aggregata TaxID=3073239 RepID=UPI002ED0FC47
MSKDNRRFSASGDSASDYVPLVGWNPEIEPTRWLVLGSDTLLMNGQSFVWSLLAECFVGKNIQSYLVGYWQGEPIALVMADASLVNSNQWVPVRSLLPTASDSEFALLNHALQLKRSSEAHRFCGLCGAATKPVLNEWSHDCSLCHHRVYPRVSPCIIVLVTKGEELLLVKHKRHQSKPSPFFTVIAGFIEPGESAEAAVAREVMEEVGLTVDNIHYQCSQSWPFPHSLMLGFHATYVSGNIVLEEKELVEGYWFTVDNLPDIPAGYTISRQLIDAFIEK